MDKEIKICPRCEQELPLSCKPKYFSGRVILCDECYAMWLGDMKIFGQYGKILPIIMSLWRIKA